MFPIGTLEVFPTFLYQYCNKYDIDEFKYSNYLPRASSNTSRHHLFWTGKQRHGLHEIEIPRGTFLYSPRVASWTTLARN